MDQQNPGIQTALAGKEEEQQQVDFVVQDVASMVASTVPIVGNYRQQAYRELVDEAVVVIKNKLFNRAKANQNALGVASCCNCWGEARSLAAGGHPPSKIHKFDNRKPLNRLTKETFKAKVLGPSPDDWSTDPWEVLFPKYLVPCTEKPPRPYHLRVLVAFAHQPLDQEPQETARLGKRNFEELAPLDLTESTKDKGRPDSKDILPNLDESLILETSQAVKTDTTDTIDPFLTRASFFQQEFIQKFGSEAYFNMLRKAYLSQPLDEWPSSQ